ncbi:MAG: hypothetical protein A4E49_00475 [Methanosaeta sp. PtaU1.Bin112]|nr:MAG: hypothetical protein A4E49_00475 [Methanosaeta sp. PtaU1.Bin112]
MLPKSIHDRLQEQDLPVLYEIRDIVASLIAEKEASLPEPGSDREAMRELVEVRHSGSMTYRLERVSCGKNCKGCPHGPYWYGYWREGGKTHSKYIGKNLRKKL